MSNDYTEQKPSFRDLRSMFENKTKSSLSSSYSSVSPSSSTNIRRSITALPNVTVRRPPLGDKNKEEPNRVVKAEVISSDSQPMSDKSTTNRPSIVSQNRSLFEKKTSGGTTIATTTTTTTIPTTTSDKPSIITNKPKIQMSNRKWPPQSSTTVNNNSSTTTVIVETSTIKPLPIGDNNKPPPIIKTEGNSLSVSQRKALFQQQALSSSSSSSTTTTSSKNLPTVGKLVLPKPTIISDKKPIVDNKKPIVSIEEKKQEKKEQEPIKEEKSSSSKPEKVAETDKSTSSHHLSSISTTTSTAETVSSPPPPPLISLPESSSSSVKTSQLLDVEALSTTPIVDKESTTTATKSLETNEEKHREITETNKSAENKTISTVVVEEIEEEVIEEIQKPFSVIEEISNLPLPEVVIVAKQDEPASPISPITLKVQEESIANDKDTPTQQVQKNESTKIKQIDLETTTIDKSSKTISTPSPPLTPSTTTPSTPPTPTITTKAIEEKEVKKEEEKKDRKKEIKKEEIKEEKLETQNKAAEDEETTSPPKPSVRDIRSKIKIPMPGLVPGNRPVTTHFDRSALVPPPLIVKRPVSCATDSAYDLESGASFDHPVDASNCLPTPLLERAQMALPQRKKPVNLVRISAGDNAGADHEEDEKSSSLETPAAVVEKKLEDSPRTTDGNDHVTEKLTLPVTKNDDNDNDNNNDDDD